MSVKISLSKACLRPNCFVFEKERRLGTKERARAGDQKMMHFFHLTLL